MPRDSIQKFPLTLNMAYHSIDVRHNSFVQYIMCPGCDAVFDFEYGYEKHNNEIVIRKCPHVKYPNHPQLFRQKSCDTLLMKIIKGRNGTSRPVPLKVYAYQPLKIAITNLLNKTGVLEKCNFWYKRQEIISDGLMGDVYDGAVWKEFMNTDDSASSQLKLNLCLTINVDWFQPFSRTRKCN